MSRYTQTLRPTASAEAIRQALTTAQGIQGWWARQADIAPGVGGQHTLTFDKGDQTVVMRFRVDTIDAGRVRWTCTDNGNPVWPGTHLEWRIADNQIHFEHGGFADGTAGTPPHQMTVDTWPMLMASLQAFLETGVGQPW